MVEKTWSKLKRLTIDKTYWKHFITEYTPDEGIGMMMIMIILYITAHTIKITRNCHRHCLVFTT